MNIAIDIRPLMEGKLSGIEVYTTHLLRELLKMDRNNTYILFANAAKSLGTRIPEFKEKNVTVVQTRIPNKILNAGLCFLRYPKLDKLIMRHLRKHPSLVPENMGGRSIDLFFLPDLRPCALSKNVTKITTIHDLSFVHFKKFFSRKTRLWYKLMKPLREIRTSDRLIAVSSFTKEDLVRTYGIPEEKITVIHEGIEESFCKNLDEKAFQHIRRRYNLPEKYYLFLSTLEPRKNIHNLVKGFMIYKLLNRKDNAKLVLAGAKNPKIFSKVVMKELHPDIMFTGFIDEEDKESVIKHAAAFLYPSFFEGFGLPLLEAMKCGTPIITSNTSAMPEVAGDAAILVNPNFPDAIATALEKIQKPEIRETLQKKMAEQVKKFSWKECARKTLELFER